MYLLRRFGFHVVKFLDSIGLFFRFFGHLGHSLKSVLSGQNSLVWFDMVEILYYSGARLAFPLTIICVLLAFSFSQTMYFILVPFHFESKVLPITQQILTHDMLPLLLCLVVCIQAALNLINTHKQRASRSPEEILLNHVIPIIIGLNITSLLLYTYTVVGVFLSIYFTFRYFFDVLNYEILSYLASRETLLHLIYSIFKTMCLSTLVSLVAGYYYYEAAVRHLPLRKAVSRIITRGLLWVVLVNGYITFMI